MDTAFPQNLVPDPSFEDTANCAGPVFSWIESAPPWYTPNLATPDVFTYAPNGCGIQYDADVQAVYGAVGPGSGQRVAGIIAYEFIDPPGSPETKDYLAIELLEPLEAGTTYELGMKCRLGMSCQYALSRLGAHFSTDSLHFPNPFVIEVQPTVVLSDGSAYLDNTLTWQWASNTFVAQGGEKYMIIGCFDDSTEVDILERPGWFNQQTYYFLDDIQLVPTFPQSITELHWIRDGEGYRITWSLHESNAGITVYDGSGRIIPTRELIRSGTNEAWFSLPRSAARGLYIVELATARSLGRSAIWHGE